MSNTSASSMVIEQRCYTTHPGKLNEYLRLYETEGLAVQLRILGRMVGYYRSEVGELNQVVHLWAYTDLVERAERRKTLLADSEFLAYTKKMLPLLVHQESRILLPAAFFKPSWMTAADMGL